VRAGLRLLNISLDTLRPERFERMTRRRGHERIMAVIQQALRLGFDPVKVAPSLGRPACVSCTLRRALHARSRCL
jgi:molybdenum cofactor biosynthesis enzyme MoaA